MLIKEQLCCVVSILGMRGLGETALAQKLCNCSVVEAFPVPDTGDDQAVLYGSALDRNSIPILEQLLLLWLENWLSQLQILCISWLHNFQQLAMKQETMPRLEIFSTEDCNTLYWIPERLKRPGQGIFGQLPHIWTPPEQKYREINGLVLHKEKRSRVEAGLVRPDLGLCLRAAATITRGFQHCFALTLAFSVHRLQDSVATQNYQLTAFHLPVAYYVDSFNDFLVFQWGLQLSDSAFTAPIDAPSRRHAVGDCHPSGDSSGFAFLSVFFPFKVVWRKLSRYIRKKN
ncbi:hypothetical protein Ddye_004092 [Dipteronia dyeriana]|uniref:Uncharacterized protein n=1 Tax=Dipteronia dyeriana TaxID=168575 RepID=A0AAE0CWQ7_9ROSI|nr:hypothetical protein Ddye_004092 [Dipteronia dyeriana]